MQDIEFVIENNALLRSSTSPVFEIQNADYTVRVYGDFLGIIQDEKVYYPEDAFVLLYTNIPHLHKAVRCVVGSCYIVVEEENKISIYCSCTSTGLFYVTINELTFLTNSEKLAYERYGEAENIQEEQILCHILSHQILLRTIPETLFSNILRCPPGGYFRQQAHEKEWGLFIQKNNEELLEAASNLSFSKQFEKFKLILEGIMALYKHYYQNKKITLLKSGGIDSAALLAAAYRGGLPLWAVRHIPYGFKSAPEKTQAGSIAEHFEYEIQYLLSKPYCREQVKHIAETGLGTIIGSQYLNYIDRELDNKGRGQQDIIELSGQNMDTLYSIDNYSPSSLTYGMVRWSRIMRSIWKRLLLTKYVMNKKFPLRKRLLQYLCPNVDHSNYNFLCSMNADVNEHILPFSTPTIHNALFEQKILFQNQNLRRKALHKQLETIGIKADQLEDLDGISLNHIARLLRWCRTPQNVPLNYYNSGKGNNVRKLIPYTEGPFVEFFINYQLGAIDTIKVKRLVHKYFKSVSGRSLEYFAKNMRTKKQVWKVFIYNLLSVIMPSSVLQKLSKSSQQQKKTDIERKNSPELEFLKEIVDTQEMYICKYVKTSKNKEFVRKLYERLDSIDDVECLTSQEDMMMYRLANLDIFLRSAMSNTEFLEYQSEENCA